MDRATFLARLHSARAEWEALLAEVGEERMLLPAATGTWSVKDVLAHIMWGEHEMVGVCRARALVGSELWQLTDEERNPIVVSCYRDRPLAEIVAEERQVYAQLLAEVHRLCDTDLNDAGRFRDMPAHWLPWQLLAGNSFQHYQDHILPIRAWLAQQA